LGGICAGFFFSHIFQAQSFRPYFSTLQWDIFYSRFQNFPVTLSRTYNILVFGPPSRISHTWLRYSTVGSHTVTGSGVVIVLDEFQRPCCGLHYVAFDICGSGCRSKNTSSRFLIGSCVCHHRQIYCTLFCYWTSSRACCASLSSRTDPDPIMFGS